ncbi:hypothetical protein ACF0H5_018008 [Mactra antiquata]
MSNLCVILLFTKTCYVFCKNFINLYIYSQGAKILSTGWGVLNHDDNVTSDGLQEVFATNLFGHYVMVRELEDFCGINGSTKIIWTSSQNANVDALDYVDIQHRNGTEPYSSSKHATDVINVALNKRLNKKGIYSITTCPGLVMTNLTFGVLPVWIWMIVMPFIYFMRLFVSSLACSPYNGAEALVWVSKQKCESLNSRVKYCSLCSVTGKTYVGEEKLKVEDSDADNLYEQLDELYKGFKQKYSSEKNDTLLRNGHSNGVS